MHFSISIRGLNLLLPVVVFRGWAKIISYVGRRGGGTVIRYGQVMVERLPRVSNLIFVCSLLPVCLYAPVTSAEIYRYIDEKGIVHFSDAPTSAGFRPYLRKRSEKKRGKSGGIYDGYIKKAAEKNGLPFSLLKALIKVESDFNPRAVSRVGAKGLMQIMPGNFQELRIRDPYNAYENIMGGSLYLKKLLKRFDGNLILALAAYNAGPSTVARYKTVPPYRETVTFIKRVLKYNRLYGKKPAIISNLTEN